MIDTSQKTKIGKNLNENVLRMDEMIGNSASFDSGKRTLSFRGKQITFYYVNGLIDTNYLIQLLGSLSEINENLQYPNIEEEDVFSAIINQLIHQSVVFVEDFETAAIKSLSGLLTIFVEGEDRAIVVDVRSYPGRGPAESDNERVVRGSRDGFTENIIINTALIRRRIRDNGLSFQIMQIGERSHTDVCVAYIEGIANPKIVEELTERLKDIKIDGLTMAEKTLEEFVFNQGYNPYPYARYTERPDVAAAHLLEGNVLIICDTSPSVIIAPTTFWHQVQHAEEFRQVPLVGTLLRWIRYFGVFLSIYLLPIWLSFVYDPSLLPEQYRYIGPESMNNIPIVMQVLIADIGLEFLRMAAIHTPSSVSTAMGLVAGAVLGSVAVEVGFFVPEIVLYVSIAAIGAFATPSYELALANKLTKFMLVIVVGIFHAPGLIVAATIHMLYLINMKSLSVPYLWPFIPFDPDAFKRVLFRIKVPGSKMRPSVIHPLDKESQ